MKKTNAEIETIKEIEKNKDGVYYKYTLYSKRSKKVASFHMPLYSIEVKMTKDGITSENSIKDIFSDIGKASAFFDKLVANLATPIDLTYILEDKITV